MLADAVDLGGRRRVGDEDLGAMTELARGVRHRQPEVPAGGGDDARRRHVGREHLVERSPRLERPRVLHQLELEDERHLQAERARARLHDRRRTDVARDPAARRLDVRALHDRRLAGELRRHRTSRNNVRTSSSDIASTSSPRSFATAANRSYRSPKPRIVRRSALSPSTPSLRATATTENRTSPISSSAFSASSGLDRGRQLVDLLPERGERALRRAPLEPPAGRPALHLRRARQRRQRRGDVVLDRLLPAGLLGLQPLPVHEHLVGAAHLDLAEHVRVPVDQLLDQPLRHVVHVPPAVVGRDLRVERDLEQQIAELVADRVGVLGVDRLEQLVRLFEQVARERLVRLLRVPRTAARRTQPRLHADQVEETRSALAGRDGTFGNVGEALAHAEGPAGADGVAVSVDVLEMRRKPGRVSSSKRPYFGLTSTTPPDACLIRSSR